MPHLWAGKAFQTRRVGSTRRGITATRTPGQAPPPRVGSKEQVPHYGLGVLINGGSGGMPICERFDSLQNTVLGAYTDY